jgi:hypothetical protein
MKKSPLLSTCGDVVGAIDDELRYQNNLPACRADDLDHGVSGQLVTLQALGIKANEAWYSNHGEEEALDIIRKIAATAVRALILYGCPKRGEPLKLQNKGYQPPPYHADREA